MASGWQTDRAYFPLCFDPHLWAMVSMPLKISNAASHGLIVLLEPSKMNTALVEARVYLVWGMLQLFTDTFGTRCLCEFPLSLASLFALFAVMSSQLSPRARLYRPPIVGALFSLPSGLKGYRGTYRSQCLCNFTKMPSRGAMLTDARSIF